MAGITRRNFLAASAVTAGLMGLVGCGATTSDEEGSATTNGATELPAA